MPWLIPAELQMCPGGVTQAENTDPLELLLSHEQKMMMVDTETRCKNAPPGAQFVTLSVKLTMGVLLSIGTSLTLHTLHHQLTLCTFDRPQELTT